MNYEEILSILVWNQVESPISFQEYTELLDPMPHYEGYEGDWTLSMVPMDGSQDSGWCFTSPPLAEEDEWMEEFGAGHPEFGTIHGSFGQEVHFESREALAHFLFHHAPQWWDGWDI